MSDMTLAAAAPRRTVDRRIVPLIALILLLAILAADAASLAISVKTIVGYRYDIDYGEGIVWQQMLNIAAGRGYGPIGVFPAIVYHYPPVYHLTVAAVTALTGADALAVGRLVSLFGMSASALLVGGIAYAATRSFADRDVRRMAALFAALLFPACQPVAEWAPTMRVDMLACFFSLAGLALTLAALERPRLILPAALAFVLGVYSKQTSVAAPAAAIVGLALTRPRLALACLVTTSVLGLAILAALSIATDGGFLRHVILYNINRNELGRLVRLMQPMRTHAPFLVFAIIGACAAFGLVRSRPQADAARATLLILGLHFAFKTAMLAMIVKSGGSSNYMIEWFAPMSIFAAIGTVPVIGVALGSVPRGFPSRLATPLIATILLGATVLPAARLGQWTDFSQAARDRQAKLDRLVVAIRNSPQPVISDDMTLLIRAGRPVMWEPSIAAELASVGRYDEPRFVDMIRAHCFSGFVTVGQRGDRVFNSRYNPLVADAMDAAYPRLRIYAGLLLHLPPKESSTRDCGAVR